MLLLTDDVMGTQVWQRFTGIDSPLNKRHCPWRSVWARGHCRISPPRLLAECCKRQLNQDSFVLLYFRLSAFSDLYWVCLSVFCCTVSFVIISQVIGCEDRLRNDLYCVEWGVKLYSNQHPTNLGAQQQMRIASRREPRTALLRVRGQI